MGEVADASVATKGYSDALVKASNRVDELSSTYEEVSAGLTGLVNASAEGASTGAGLAKMNENLNSLNSMYEGQLQQLEQNKQLFEGMGELVQNLNDSIDDTKVYKENISELAKNSGFSQHGVRQHAERHGWRTQLSPEPWPEEKKHRVKR